jgi:hypothetical protein
MLVIQRKIILEGTKIEHKTTKYIVKLLFFALEVITRKLTVFIIV